MRAKKINEFGGAGFSYSGASMSTSRPGGINRGGFSGANNLGGPNMMYTYEIKPLNRTLQPEANDTEGEESISKGNDISGAELNAKDNKLHAGVVMDIVSAEDGSLMYYVILNPDTSSQMRIDPTTARLISKLDGVDPLGTKLSPEEESLVNPGQKSLPAMSQANESFKLVKEAFYDERVKMNTRKKLNKTPGLHLTPEETDEYMDRYEDSHGVPMRSKKMAKNVETSVLNDRSEMMKDVYGFGSAIQNAFKELGIKSEAHGYGRTKDGRPIVGIEIDNKDHHFSMTKDGQVFLDKFQRDYKDHGLRYIHGECDIALDYADRKAGKRGRTTRDCHTFGSYKDHDNLVKDLYRFFYEYTKEYKKHRENNPKTGFKMKYKSKFD